MPGKCNCAGSSCSCLIQAGAGVTVSGVGSADRPYLISSAPVGGEINLTPGEDQYIVGAQGTPLGAINAFQVEFPGEVTTGYIRLPDGTTSVPTPPVGAQFDFYVIGSETASYDFIGASFTWGKEQPTSGNQQGWYHLVYLPVDGLARYLITYVK